MILDLAPHGSLKKCFQFIKSHFYQFLPFHCMHGKPLEMGTYEMLPIDQSECTYWTFDHCQR